MTQPKVMPKLSAGDPAWAAQKKAAAHPCASLRA